MCLSLSLLQARSKAKALAQALQHLKRTRPTAPALDPCLQLACSRSRCRAGLIVAASTPPALAAKAATSTIPIVAQAMGDPVQDGLVASLASPGGNVSGNTFLGPALVRWYLLKEAFPAVSRVAALLHPGAYGEQTMQSFLRE